MSAELAKALREAMSEQSKTIAPLLAIMRRKVAETAQLWRKYQ